MVGFLSRGTFKFTANDTYNKTSGVERIRFYYVAGGAGGTAGGEGVGCGGAAGGAGWIDVPASAITGAVAIIIGAGGAGANAPSSGGNGTSTTLTMTGGSVTIGAATGGQGGYNGVAGVGTVAVFAGITPFSVRGGYGEPGTTVAGSANGGSSHQGPGGLGNRNPGGQGGAAENYGAGGGGDKFGVTSGAGKSGIVIIEEFFANV